MARPRVDHHLHFMATVASRLSLDVSDCLSLGGLMARLEAARPGPGWMRAWGYEEWRLAEGRHPTREDLDRAVGGRPLVLHHRSGHAAVLNSAALEALGRSDHPDGILVDGHRTLAAVPRLEERSMERVAAGLSREWAAAGLSGFVDATHTNGADEIGLLSRWCARGVIVQDVTAMIAPGAAGSLPACGERVGPVRVGPVKLMPDGSDLSARVAAAHAAGRPVAVHVVELDVMEDLLAALEASPPPEGTRDRVEHAALTLPEHVGRLAALRAVVVVNPSFLHHRRQKYRRELVPLERSWLIRLASFVRAGVEVRAGSDSPVAPVDPAGIEAAARAHPFSPAESLDARSAARLLDPLD